jgi:hypothetical protein
MIEKKLRPYGVTALSFFFLFGALMSLIASVSLFFRGSFIDKLWRLNPHAYEGLSRLGIWASVLLFVVSFGCAGAAIGLWRRRRWGHLLALIIISINLVGDLANAVTGAEPRAIVGVPIAGAILWYLLSRQVRGFFGRA